MGSPAAFGYPAGIGNIDMLSLCRSELRCSSVRLVSKGSAIGL
jgi:hypothetical protein